jgi:hypothetical protein
VRFGALGLADVLKGKLEDLGGGRIKLQYSFDSPDELQDFLPAGDYLSDHRERLPPLPDGLKHAFWQEEGALRAEGRAALRHVLPFSAPMSIEYDLSVDIPKQDTVGPPYLFLGLCDDGDAHFAWSSNFGDLEVWSEGKDVQSERQTSSFLRIGRGTVESLVHDGARVSLVREKQPVASLACPHQRGDVFLWSHSGMQLYLRRLTLEGTLDEAGREALRDRWVERALAAF